MLGFSSIGVVGVAAGVTCLAAYAGARWLSGRSFALDYPTWRSQHHVPVPRSGGLAMCGAFLLGAAVWLVGDSEPRLASREILAVTAAALGMALVGIWDDVRSLSPLTKLVFQILAAGGVVASGVYIEHVGLPGGYRVELGWLGPVVSLLWLLVAMNATNFIDGADGLVSKSLVAGFLGIAFLAFVVGREEVAGVSVLLAAASWGFYWVNRPPARIFMGDSGSQFLGMMIGGVTLVAAPPVEERLSLAVPPMVFLPILFDAVFTVVRRALFWQPVWRAHRGHLFQIALRAGMSPLVLSRVYLGLTCLAVACGWFMLATPSPWHHIWILPPLAAQMLWLFLVDRMRRRNNIKWDD